MKKILLIILLLQHLHYGYAQNTHYDSLNNLISSAGDDSARISSSEILIWDYLYSYPDSAAIYIQQDIILAQKIKSDKALFQAYIQYSVLERVNGNYTVALQHGIRAMRIGERVNDFISICEAYFNLGDIYREAGDFKQTIYNDRKAKILLESKLNPVFEREKNHESARHYVACIVDLARTFETFNRLDSALKYGKMARDLYLRKWGTSVDTLFLSSILAPIMGNIYSKSGAYSTALYYYRWGEAIARSKTDLMENYNGAATVFKKMGQPDSAIFYANKVLELGKDARSMIGKLAAFTLLSDVYKLRRNTDSVAKYLALIIETKDSLFNTKKVMDVQSISFNEELRQKEIREQENQYRNRMRTYLLGGGLLGVLLLAGILYRSNRHKQNAKVKIERAYEDLKRAQAQLIQSEKMASLGELTAGIAHEIQNPLNFVNNFSEVNRELIEELKNQKSKLKSEEQDEILNDIDINLEKISHHGKRADAIVKGMLQHSRTSSGQKEPTDINALCDEYLRLAYHGLRAKDKNFNADFKTDFDESIGKINVVQQDIGRVLLNTYNNAFYAVNEKKKLLDGTFEPAVTVSTKRVGDKIEISVKDNGTGIPQKAIDKVFQPFFTTKPTGQGTGLGLSLSYDIIKAHGGEIKVEATQGEGSEFTIVLPR